MFTLLVQVSLFALVVCQYVPISVFDWYGDGPLDLSETDLSAAYCEAKHKECPGDDLVIYDEFAADPHECHARCNRLPWLDLQCRSAFYSTDQICYLRANRCTSDQLLPSNGTTYYRLKKGEKCPSDQPPYVPFKEYSDSFCYMANKSCPGHNFYKTPRSIPQRFFECLKKCARIQSCAGVDYVEGVGYNGGKCSPKNYQCSEAELVDAPGTENYIRLEKGVTSCPCNRPGRSLTPISPPAPITVIVISDGPLDLSKTDLSTSYCVAKDKECRGVDLETVFAADPQQCQARCNRNLKCLLAFHSTDQTCHLRAQRCTSDQLLPSAGVSYYRLKKTETCPSNQPPYVEASKAYSNSFCVVLAGKSCPGNNLYPKPQNIQPDVECLAKCARITSCSGVDFDGKCSPKNYTCSDVELVDTPGNVNYIRLEKGVTTCPCRQPRLPPPGPEQVPLMVFGARIKRGPDWRWGDEDGPAPGLGTIIQDLFPPLPGWVAVEWDTGHHRMYSMGNSGSYDLQLA